LGRLFYLEQNMPEMIRVEGIGEMKKFLEEFDARMQDRAMRGALTAGGEVFQAAVQEAAPERVEWLGGRLPPGAMKADVQLVTKRLDDGQLAAIVQFGKLTYFIASWVEYGHRLLRRAISGKAKLKVRGGGRGEEIGTVDPHPFIRPAFEGSKASAIQAFVERFKAELRKR
jgi:HK97 gp10 family phage protein